MNNIRAGAVQFEHTAGDKQANLAKVRAFAAQAAEQNVQLICFPECCITGYWFLKNLSRGELAALAEPVFDGPSSQELVSLAKEHDMIVGAGLVEITGAGELFNTYVVATPQGNLHRHRKMHCFISEYMASGSDYTVFDTDLGRIGVLICYDNNIIENGRITALLGAEVLLAPHQTGGCKTSSPFAMGLIDPALWHNRRARPVAIEAEFRGEKGRGWIMRWLPARAHDNGVFLLFANGVGVDGDEIRTGNAVILDCYGRTLAETWVADDAMVVADLDASLLDRCTGRRWLRTRRPDLYGPLTVPTGQEIDTRISRFEKTN